MVLGVKASAMLTHNFHGKCLSQWLGSIIYKNCPVCRQPTIEDHDEDVWPDYAVSVRRSLEITMASHRLKVASGAETRRVR